MTLIGFRGRNHPQQRAKRAPSLFAEYDDPTDGTDDRGTDPALFRLLDDRHHFTVDAAASPANTKCERYWTATDDGLTQPWADEHVWCNPPFSNISPWVRKAHHETAALTVMLLPANRLSVTFLPGRLRFVPNLDTAKGDRPPFGCCLATWTPT